MRQRETSHRLRGTAAIAVLVLGVGLAAGVPLEAQPVQPAPGRLVAEGQLKAQQRDFAGAIADFTAWLNVHPDDAVALFHRSHARAELGDQQGAAEDVQKIVRQNVDAAGKAVRESPNDKATHAALARVRLEAGDVQGAIDSYGKVLSLDANDVDALFGRGNARQMSGDREGALKDYAAALERGHDRPEIYIARAHTREELGDVAGANEDLQRALEHGSHHQ
jgi:tetratricopeptide (TPR) repeat protein